MTARMLLTVLLAFAPVANAHHSYSVYDGARELSVDGVIARFEWVNPHVFIWMYVRNDASGGYELYAFENGGINGLTRRGWTKATFIEGEAVTMVYWPLKDGRHGGHMKMATHADGRVTRGVGGPRGVNGDAPVRVPADN